MLGGLRFAAVVVFVVVVVVVVSVRRLSSRVRRGNGCRGKESARRSSLPGQGGKGGGVPGPGSGVVAGVWVPFPSNPFKVYHRCLKGD